LNRRLVVVALLLGALSAACGPGQILGPTVTPTATSTPIPTATLTPTATPPPTAIPTATSIPTPASIGASVPYGSLRITVVKVDRHVYIVPGGLYYWRPPDKTKIVLDLGVLIRNEDPDHAVLVQTENMTITEADGTSSTPFASEYNTVQRGGGFDPLSLSISSHLYPKGVFVLYGGDTYFRLIFAAAKNQAVLFGLEDSPKISIEIGP
jgi:hypothetical protein